MANWKQAPGLKDSREVPGGTAEAGSAGDVANWGLEGWSQVNVAGVVVPFEAAALPVAVIALYLVFRSLYLFRARRVSMGTNPAPLPEMPVRGEQASGR